MYLKFIVAKGNLFVCKPINIMQYFDEDRVYQLKLRWKRLLKFYCTYITTEKNRDLLSVWYFFQLSLALDTAMYYFSLLQFLVQHQLLIWFALLMNLKENCKRIEKTLRCLPKMFFLPYRRIPITPMVKELTISYEILGLLIIGSAK